MSLVRENTSGIDDNDIVITGINTKTTHSYTKVCHGCEGKGWVCCDNKPQVCPICDGKGNIKETIYNDLPSFCTTTSNGNYDITLCSNSIKSDCSNCRITKSCAFCNK